MNKENKPYFNRLNILFKSTEIQFKELSSDANIAKLKFMEEAATDESYRLPCTFNEEYSGVPGSFKTLCVD